MPGIPGTQCPWTLQNRLLLTCLTLLMVTLGSAIGGGLVSPFSPHPTMEERIARLERLARGGR